MFDNIGKRDILIFPKFNNIDKIQEVRNKYDKLANLIPPHITLAFPFRNNSIEFSNKIVTNAIIRNSTYKISNENASIRMVKLQMKPQPSSLTYYRILYVYQDKSISRNLL